ncbi:MAG: hypothetical protein ACOX2F_11645 [bacterium]
MKKRKEKRKSLKKIKRKKEKRKKRVDKYIFFLFLLIFCFKPLTALEEFGGSVSIGSSYDSNPGDDEISEVKGGKKRSGKNIGDFSSELTADLFIYPAKQLYLDYFSNLDCSFTDKSYSFFFHSGEIAFEHEFNSFDLNLGAVFGHAVYDFDEVFNRVEIEPYIEAVHYHSDNSSGWYRLSYQYKHPFELSDFYYKGHKVSADISEYFTFMNEKSSFFMNSIFSLYFLENTIEEYEAFTVEKKNSYFSFFQDLKLKLGVSVVDFIPQFSYELSYFLAKDKWGSSKKRRIDHSISPSFKMAVNATSYLAIALNYKYFKNFSSPGDNGIDYYNFNYDRHRVTLELLFNF